MSMSRAVVVTTDKRGVFFGYCVTMKMEDGTTTDLNRTPDSIVLTNARNCLYWSAETRGFMGLASSGPAAGSRVGPAVESITLFGVTAILEASTQAVERWESGPWSA